MATITTTSYATPLIYPNQAYIDRSLSGTLYFLKRFGTTDFGIFQSTNNGASWSDVGINITRANLQETSSLFCDAEGTLHIAYRTYESGQDRIYYRNRPSGGAWSSEIMISAQTGAVGDNFRGLDLCAFKLNNQWFVFVAVALSNNALASGGVIVYALTRVGSPTYEVRNSLVGGTRAWLTGPAGVQHCSIDFKHTGDGKTPKSNPDIWVSWGRDNPYCVKFTSQWSTGPVWYGPQQPVVVATPLSGWDYVTGRYDGYRDRFNITVPAGDTVYLVERAIDNTSAQARQTPSHPQGVIRHHTFSNGTTNGNFRIYAVGTSNANLYFIDYTRATGLFGAWTLVTGTAVLGVNNFGVRNNNSGNGAYDLTIAHSGSPNTINHTSGVLAVAPSAPNLTTPINGNPYDVNTTLPITWIFTDDDPSDVQTAYVLRRKIGAGAYAYWNAGTSSWGASEVWNSSGSSSVTLASGWGADSDDNHAYSVKVRDSTSQDSDYGPEVIVIPSAKDNPTITAPAAAAVITTGRISATWTVATQTARMVELKKSGVRVHWSGWGNTTDTFYNFPTDLDNASSYSIEVTTRNDEGLTSTMQSVSFTTSFTPPPLPFRVTATPGHYNGFIIVNILNAAPSGGQPAITGQDVFRREVGSTGDGVRVATGVAFQGNTVDFTAKANTNYEYRVQIFGNNNTSIYSPWYS